MPTVNKAIADRCIAGNGYYPGDHIRVIRVTEYDNAYGGVSYGLDYEGTLGRPYSESEFVRNPRVYWEAK